MEVLSREEQAAALDGLNCALAVLDQDSNILHVNQAWRDWSVDNGGPPDGFEGTRYLDSIRTDLDPGLEALRTAFRRALEGQLDSFDHQYPCDSPIERRWFIMKVQGFEVGGERRLTILHVQINVQGPDEDRLLEGIRPDYQQFTDRILRLVGHQFRTPLTPLQMDTKSLVARAGTDLEPLVSRIQRNVDRLYYMVDSSIALLKIEQGSTINRQGRMALQTLRDAVTTVGDHLGIGDRIRIEVDGDDTPISLDLAWTGRALRELLDNAARMSDGDIRVGLRTAGGELHVTIRDEGDGFEEDPFQAPVFRPGEKDANITSGAGLGLALVKAVVQAHEGNVAARVAEPGRGGEVTIRLPTGAGRHSQVQRPPRPDRNEAPKRGVVAGSG